MAEAVAASIGEAVAMGRRILERAGVQTPALDAQLLLAEVLGVDRARLVIDRDDGVPVAAGARYRALLDRRAAREPVAYILGRREFRRLMLHVDRRVLIPRPETELLVEVGLGLPGGARVVDAGTGSGAVALALKDERPDLSVRGVDASPGAVAVARENAARLGLDVSFGCADLLDEGPVDAMLANLPYVAEDARGSLAPEITRYEPPEALFAGADGLDVVRRVVALASERGVQFLALEIGCEQAGAVRLMLGAVGYERVEVRRDLAGIDRVVIGSGRRPPGS